jgi:nicotinamidase-related amidase
MTNKLLLVIDVQKGFINNYTKEIPKKIKNHLEQNSNKYNFIAFTKFINTKDSNFVKQINWHSCIKNNEIELVDEIKGFVTKDNLFEKHTYSAFKSKQLLEFIKRNHITKMYLCGLNIDACILASAFEAFDLGYEIHILKDLTNTFFGPAEYADIMLKNLGYKIDKELLK